MDPLKGFHIVSLAVNVPGPVAAARLRDFGATVTKIEPPDGDPLARLGSGWYESLKEGMQVLRLNLKEPSDRSQLDIVLESADLLLTASRPAALERLGLGWEQLQQRFPKLCHVAIVGYPPPNENVPGHDLTYQAAYGMLCPPQMPRVLVGDMAGSERAATAAIALLLGRERGKAAGQMMVSLSDAADAFAESIRRDVTTEGSVLGGGLPNYAIYETRSGFLACAALELHFYQRLLIELGRTSATQEDLEAIFMTRTAEEWEDWAEERDIPLKAIKTAM